MASRTASAPWPASAGPVLHARPVVVARHAGQVEQHREPRPAFHQGADRGTAQTQDEIPLPVARHRPVGRFHRALADHHPGDDKGFASSTAARPRHAQRPPGAQAGGQLAAQGAPALHVERLVDGLVADAHRRIVRKVEPQAAGDLLRAPRRGPAPVPPAPVPPPLPGHDRPADRGPARGDDHAGQPVPHVTPQRRVDRQFRRLRAAGGPLGMPLRGGGTVVQTTAARGGIAPQLPRDRRRRSPEPAGDLSHPMALRPPKRELLPFREQQIPPGRRLQRWRRRRWWHAARLPKPPCPHRRRHPCVDCRVLTRQTRRDRRPEPPPVLTPRHRRPTWRSQHASPRPIRASSPSMHRNPLRRGVATTT
jgi:hypothetical protein